MRELGVSVSQLRESLRDYGTDSTYLAEATAAAVVSEMYVVLESNGYEPPARLTLEEFIEGAAYVLEHDSELSEFDRLILLEALQLQHEGVFDTLKGKLKSGKYKLTNKLLKGLPKAIHRKLASRYAAKASDALFYGDYAQHKHANRMHFFHLKQSDPEAIQREREIAKQYGHARPGSSESSRRSVYAAKKMRRAQSALSKDIANYRAANAAAQTVPDARISAQKVSPLAKPFKALASKVKTAIDTAKHGKAIEKAMQEIPLPPLDATDVYPSRKSRRIVLPKSTHITADTRPDGSRRG